MLCYVIAISKRVFGRCFFFDIDDVCNMKKLFITYHDVIYDER